MLTQCVYINTTRRSIVVVSVTGGDVLVRTVPQAQCQELARRTGLDAGGLASLISAEGLTTAFDHGQMSAEELTTALRYLLSCPGLEVRDVRECWYAVPAGVDNLLAPIAAGLAAVGRLTLVSNTNAMLWSAMHRILAGVAIDAPAYLSFEVGTTMPGPRFSAAIIDTNPTGYHGAVFVDHQLPMSRPRSAAA